MRSLIRSRRRIRVCLDCRTTEVRPLATALGYEWICRIGRTRRGSRSGSRCTRRCSQTATCSMRSQSPPRKSSAHTKERFQRSSDRFVLKTTGNVLASGEMPVFDTFTAPAHPKGVPSLLKRLAALACVLAFAQGAVVECAGWQATPEARRQCCQNGACPLHHREDGAARTKLTQAAADDCCAQSERRDSSPSRTVFTSTMTLAVVQSLPPVVLSLSPTVPLRAPWETPSPPGHVPKHVLLSVFLL